MCALGEWGDVSEAEAREHGEEGHGHGGEGMDAERYLPPALKAALRVSDLLDTADRMSDDGRSRMD